MNQNKMFKWSLFIFALTYFAIGLLLLFQDGYWLIPSDSLIGDQEKFFLIFILFQMTIIYVISSQIKEERYQMLFMLNIFLISFCLGLRDLADFIYNQKPFMKSPLIILSMGQGVIALSFLINLLRD